MTPRSEADTAKQGEEESDDAAIQAKEHRQTRRLFKDAVARIEERIDGVARAQRAETEKTRLMRELKRVRRLPGSGPFLLVAQPAQDERRTLLSLARLHLLWQAARSCARIEGAIIEIGVYRGGSTRVIAEAVRSFDAQRRVVAIDTFEGHPADQVSDFDGPAHRPGHFGDATVEDVQEYLSDLEHVTVVQGAAPQALEQVPEEPIAFAHLDVDLYWPTLETLSILVERLAPGGCVVVDDYASGKCPGVARAVQEVLGKSDGLRSWELSTTEQILLQQP